MGLTATLSRVLCATGAPTYPPMTYPWHQSGTVPGYPARDSNTTNQYPSYATDDNASPPISYHPHTSTSTLHPTAPPYPTKNEQHPQGYSAAAMAGAGGMGMLGGAMLGSMLYPALRGDAHHHNRDHGDVGGSSFAADTGYIDNTIGRSFDADTEAMDNGTFNAEP